MAWGKWKDWRAAMNRSPHSRHEAGGEELSLKLEAATDEDVEAGVARKGSSILKENNSSPNTAPVGKEFDKKESLAEQQSNGQGEEGEMGEEEEPLPPEDMQEAPRMHVMVAIVCTFAWIFFCAGLFRLWEVSSLPPFLLLLIIFWIPGLELLGLSLFHVHLLADRRAGRRECGEARFGILSLYPFFPFLLIFDGTLLHFRDHRPLAGLHVHQRHPKLPGGFVREIADEDSDGVPKVIE
jgi:hypothetical protein